MAMTRRLDEPIPPGLNPGIIGGGTISDERCPDCHGLLMRHETTGYISGWDCPHCGFLTLTTRDTL
jgi:predicted RNA-binding Zn-ribbon protein involved in translation (DUF1610 family)